MINLDDKELIKPYSSVLAQHHPDLDDMNLDAGVRPSPQGIGAQIGPLLERLNRSGWSAIELSPEQLTLIPMIMGILGKGWDAAATLDAVKVPEGLAWRLSLPAAIEQRPANGPGFASADGDESWTEMRARLARCSTREALRRAWNAEQADEADISIAVDEPAAQQDLSEFENAVSEYVHGNGLRLYATLSELPEDTVGRGFELVLNTLGAKGWRLATRGPSIDDVNRRLLAFAAGKWSSLHELERILPRERVRLTDLAMVRLIPEMLVEVVRRNASAEPHELIALRYPDVSPELWENDRAPLAEERRRPGRGCEDLPRLRDQRPGTASTSDCLRQREDATRPRVRSDRAEEFLAERGPPHRGRLGIRVSRVVQTASVLLGDPQTGLRSGQSIATYSGVRPAPRELNIERLGVTNAGHIGRMTDDLTYRRSAADDTRRVHPAFRSRRIGFEKVNKKGELRAPEQRQRYRISRKRQRSNQMRVSQPL